MKLKGAGLKITPLQGAVLSSAAAKRSVPAAPAPAPTPVAVLSSTAAPATRRSKRSVDRDLPGEDDFFSSVLSRIQLTNYSDKVDPDSLPAPKDLLEQAIDNDFSLDLFSKEQWPVAQNIVDWCYNPEMLGNSTKPFAKQFQTMVHFCSDACYSCSDIDYIFDVPIDAKYGEMMDRFVLLNRGVCPSCHRNRTDILSEWVLDPRHHRLYGLEENIISRPVPPNELCCVWGQRSGKSHMNATFLGTYQLHRYIQKPNPMAYFNEPANKLLEMVFVAPTLQQVNKFAWNPFVQAIAESPWFRYYIEYCKVEGKRLGTKLFRAATTFLLFPNKRLICHMAAANSSSLRGGTRTYCSPDELGWFNTTEDGKKRTNSKDGEEVYTSLSRSMLTLRSSASARRKQGDYDALDALMVNLSSPSSKHDPIMKVAAKAPTSPRLFYIHNSSFEINPLLDEQEIREEECAGDELKFKRDYLAIPPDAVSPFFSDKQLLLDRTFKPASGEVRPFEGYEIQKTEANGLAVLQPTLKGLKSDKQTLRILTIDNGERKNSFALCLSRYLPEIEGLLVEELIEVCPSSGRTVDLAWCHNEVVVKLIEHFNILYVGYDNWNSGYSFYDLRLSHGVSAERYRMKWQDFRDFKEDLLGENIWFSAPEVTIEDILKISDLSMRARYPRAHLLAQIVTVNEFGRKLVKPDFGNDDLFRTVALAHHFLDKNRKEFREKAKKFMRRKGPSTIVGAYRNNNPNPLAFRLPRAMLGGFSTPRSSTRGSGKVWG
jgi:hypothetical protein